jgi:hypothetical protein
MDPIKERELKRIYNSVLADLEKWDGKEPLEEFLTKLVENRLLVDRQEAQNIVNSILKGIIQYKRAKKLVKSNPKLVEKIKKDPKFGKVLQEILNFIKNLISSFKKGG